MFVTFEGIDGSGKSTQAALLAEAFEAEGREVVRTREPGGTEVGERVRALLLHGGDIAPWAEAALFAAARAQLVDEVVRPALARGAVVVCDRFLDSSLAYQGIARGLGLDAVLELNRVVLSGLLPDRTFLLLLPVDEAVQRSTAPPTASSARASRSSSGSIRPTGSLRRPSPSGSWLSTRRSRPVQSRPRSGMSFERVLEQEEAKRLLTAALHEGPAHAYLFHGPRGVGKRTAALAFAAELLGDDGRVERRAHPDLYMLEPVGEQIRIDAIRTLRHDLHMRPFEASRRIYLVFGAHLMNEDAADALLKDLEEPPGYAVIVLVADELGPLPETIRSRCQLVPFQRLSRRALLTFVSERRPELSPEALAAVVRVASGRLDRAARLLDEDAIAQREALIQVARYAVRGRAVRRR